MGGVAVKFVVSPNSSIELPGVKVPGLRTQFGVLLPAVLALIPVRPIGVDVLLPESAITSTAAFLTAVGKFTVTVPEVPVAVARKAYIKKQSFPEQTQELFDAALVVIRVAEPPDSGFAPLVLATVAVRVAPLLSSSAVTRMSSVCPAVAVMALLTSDDKFPALLPMLAAANVAVMPSKTSGLGTTCAAGLPF